jgi:dTDP-4-dehydrorhamnose reductase
MREPDLCRRDNVTGAQVLAGLCSRLGIPLVTFSSDLVFDGRLGRPYLENDPVGPRCIYGASKAEAEQLVSGAHSDALIVRTSAFFGPWDRYNFVIKTCADLRAGLLVEASETTFVSPTYVPDLVHATLDLLIDEASGVWHLANEGSVSWHGLALRAADRAGLARARLKASRGERIETALSSARGLLLPSLDSAIERFFRDLEQDMRTILPEAAE